MSAKVALITGSTSGIGLGVAMHMARQGFDVCINGFGDSTEIENIRNTIATESGQKVIYHGADLTSREQIEDLFSTIESTFGRLDVLINNAGIQFVSPIDEFPVEKWQKIIDLNLTSNLN